MNFLKSSFRNRMFFTILVASLIPVLICSAIMVQFIRIRLEDKLHEEAENQTAILHQSLDIISTTLSDAANSLQEHRLIARAMSGFAANPLIVNSLLYDATEPARSYAVFDLYDDQGNCLFSTLDAASAPAFSPNWGLLYGAASKDGLPYYYAAEDPTDADSPLLYGAVRLHASGIRRDSYLVMRIYLQGFHALLDGKYPMNDLLVLSPYFHPVYSSRSYLNTSLAPNLRAMLLKGTVPDTDSFVYSLSRHAPTGLHLLLRQQNTFGASMLKILYTISSLCALIGVIISVLLSLQISRHISHPISRLKSAFDRVEKSNLETQLKVVSQDELGQLAQRFNDMVTALKRNREQLLLNQQELKDAQIRMMQAQLNPHFLCNTLDTMKWISKINKVPQVALMSTNLADILRFAISPDEFVPLYREMEILERYIEIQKIRLGDDFSFTTQIPEEFYDCMVPKMILQPIVENAILHGFNGMTGNVIRIKAGFAYENHFRITVTDNGVGFPAEMVGRPYKRDKALAKGHLGLYNVDTILTRYYGEECGLYLDCGENGIGASVTATLPIRYEEDSQC